MWILEIIKICIWIVAGISVGVYFKGGDVPRSVFWLTYAVLMLQFVANALDTFA